MAGDLVVVDDSTDERWERRIAGGFLHGIETRITKGANAWGKPEPKQMAQGEDGISESGRVGIMLFEAGIGFMVTQPVKDRGSISHDRADEFAVEWSVLIRDVRVERRAGLITITGIDRTNAFSAAAGIESLPVGGTARAVASVCGELTLMLIIDDLGKQLCVRLLPDVPGGGARQRRERNPRTRISHSCHSKIEAIGKKCGEQVGDREGGISPYAGRVSTSASFDSCWSSGVIFNTPLGTEASGSSLVGARGSTRWNSA